MTEEIKKEPEEMDQPNGGRPWLMISLMEDGQSVMVNGWHGNKFVAYGLLGAAKDAIHDNFLKQAKIERVNNSGGLLEKLRNKRF